MSGGALRARMEAQIEAMRQYHSAISQERLRKVVQANFALLTADISRALDADRAEALNEAADDLRGIESALDGVEEVILDAEDKPFRFTATERRRFAIEDWLRHLASRDADPDTPTADAPAPDVWSGVIPPGGYVCGACGQPTESEPCPEHQERPLPERDRRTT